MTTRQMGWLGALSLLSVWWALPFLSRPLLLDEVGFVLDAVPWRFGLEWPPLTQAVLYYDLIEVGAAVLGWTGGELRWIGVLCFIGQLCFVWTLAERLQPRAGLLAAVLWGTHPMAIQGALILDIDVTVLAVGTTLWCVLVLHVPWPSLRARDHLALGLLMGVCLWTKLTTPWVFPLVLLADGLVHRRFATALRSGLWMTGWAIISVGAAWLLYLAWDPLPRENLLFQHNAASFLGGLQGNWLPWGVELVNRVARVLLWINPVLIICGGFAWWQRRRQTQADAAGRNRDLLWWFVVLVGAGYWLIGGLCYGFAKYHYPLLPVLVALVAAASLQVGFPSTRRHWGVLGLGGLVIACGWGWGVGDLFLLLNRELRHAVLFAPERLSHVLITFGVRLAVACGLACGVWGFVRWRRHLFPPAAHPAFVAALLLLVGMHGAINVQQRRAAFSTTYAYGRDFMAMRTVSARIQAEAARFPGQRWLMPTDLGFAAGIQGYLNQPHEAWQDPRVMERILIDPRTRGLVVSQTSNAAQTFRSVLPDPIIQDLLRKHFARSQIGEYTVWLRVDRAVN